MKIHALKVSLSEQDLNELIKKRLPADHPIEDLRACITQTGLVITGVYPLFINVHFETHWQLGVDEGHITVRLHQFKAMGVPGAIFKSAIVKMIEDLAKEETWIRFKGDMIWVDVDAGIGKYAFPAQTSFKVLECQAGVIVVEGFAE